MLRKLQSCDWEKRTEYIIALCGLAFALLLLVLYESSNQSTSFKTAENLTAYAVSVYPLICLLRLAWVDYGKDWALFGWVSAFVDILFLSSILYVFSLQYENPAATLKAPSYTYYYALIALHAMRFKPRLVLSMGVGVTLTWLLLVTLFMRESVNITHSYATYIASDQILLGAEIEKMVSFMLFAIILTLGVSRARNLLSEASTQQIMQFKVQEAQEAVRIKNEFLGTMSHELRTPMHGVLGMVEALKETELTFEQRKYIEVIETSGNELLIIIENILDYTRLEMGQLNDKAEEFNLNDVISDLHRNFGPKARDKHLDFITYLDPKSEFFLTGNEDRFLQVLGHLVDNAIKFTDSGHVILTVSSLAIDAEYATLSVRVEDSGIGIAKDDLDIIFEKFSQSDGSITRRHGGVGLGLSISQSLVQSKGGNIHVDSEIGKGSTFSFDIRVPYRRDARTAKHEAKRLAARDMSNVPVLIVDDQPACANILQKQLNDLGIMPNIVNTANDACVAINAVHNTKKSYKVCIIDYEMPKSNGLLLGQLIRSRSQLDDMKIIVLSSSDERLVKDGFEKIGITAYLQKPYLAEAFNEAILTAMVEEPELAQAVS